MPVGHRGLREQISQAGFRAAQTRRPCQMSWWWRGIQVSRGNRVHRSSSTFSGVFPDERARRRATRKMCVSTARAGTPKAFARTTLAVFRPTPGQRGQRLQVAGHQALVAGHQGLAEADQVPGLVPEEARGMDQGFQVGEVGLGQGGGRGIALEEGRGDEVDPRVRALGREDGGDHELEGILVLQGAAGVRVGIVQAGEQVLEGGSGPAHGTRIKPRLSVATSFLDPGNAMKLQQARARISRIPFFLVEPRAIPRYACRSHPAFWQSQR